MKKYEVLLKSDNGVDSTITIEALNENDARWAGKKQKGVYEAVVLRRKKDASEHLLMIGNAIRKARVEKGWNQTQLAEASNLRVATISDIESGKVNAQISTLQQIAVSLNCYFKLQ